VAADFETGQRFGAYTLGNLRALEALESAETPG